MNSRNTLWTMAIIVISLATLAVAMTGRTAVNRRYDYLEATRQKSLHELAMYEPEDRGKTPVYGAGLAALAMLTVGGCIFAMRGGAELLHQWRLTTKRRRKTARRVTTARLAPHVDDRDGN